MGYALAAARGENLAAAAEVLTASRPTAVNLAWAIREMQAAGSDPQILARRASRLHQEEVERCLAMSEHALALFSAVPGTGGARHRAGGARVLTHCNTGALATGGHGTALGALRTAYDRGLLEHVYVGETRPLAQGSRLTAWELERAGIPFAVVVDGAAGTLMVRDLVSHVFVGADRIAANGDVANKIGTYGLAVLAAHHGLPFVVVAPSSTVDRETMTGAGIEIEERSATEISERFPAKNPAFDVTPASLVTAIVTEVGIHHPPYGFARPAKVPAARENRE